MPTHPDNAPVSRSPLAAWFSARFPPQAPLQIGVVVSVLLLSAAAAYKATASQLRLLLLVLPGFAGLLILLRFPPLGLILTYVAGVFVQQAGPSGLSVTTAGIALLTALWLGKMIIVDRQIVLIESAAIRPVLAFLVISLLAFGIGQLPFIPFSNPAPLDAQLGGLSTFLLSGAAFLVAAHWFDQRWLRYFTGVVILIGALYMCGRLLSSQGVPIGRPFAPNATTNSMFWVWVAAMAFGQAYLNTKLPKGVRLALLGLVALQGYVAYVLSNEWKSGWVPSFVVIAAIIGLRYWRVTLFLLPFAAAAGFVAATIIIGTDEYSWSTRVDAWVIVVQMVAESSPIFGLGYANYYWYSRYYPIRGYYVPFNSHNQYVDILAQTGIVGLLSFLWIFWEASRLGFRLSSRAAEGFERAYVYGVLGGIAGTLAAAALADWVLPFTYNVGLGGFRSGVLPWIFMGGLIAIEQRVRQPAAISEGVNE